MNNIRAALCCDQGHGAKTRFAPAVTPLCNPYGQEMRPRCRPPDGGAHGERPLTIGAVAADAGTWRVNRRPSVAQQVPHSVVVPPISLTNGMLPAPVITAPRQSRRRPLRHRFNGRARAWCRQRSVHHRRVRHQTGPSRDVSQHILGAANSNLSINPMSRAFSTAVSARFRPWELAHVDARPTQAARHLPATNAATRCSWDRVRVAN